MAKIKSSQRDLDALKKEDVVQAVVVADNFTDAFLPFTTDIPSCLLPLANKCLLDHTLEWLSMSGVQEVFLFCCKHADKVKQHMQNSKWSSEMCSISIHLIVSETCCSLGDAMRDLDAKGVVRGDFILVMGDTVANVNLLSILEKHRKLQKQDKGLAMTLVYNHAGPSHRTRAPQDDVLLVVDTKSSKVLYHQKRIAAEDKRKVNVPMDIILDHPTVDIFNDLLDTHISVCSMSVLPLFSDNFDFQTRDDFIKGLLMNEEILASSLAWHRLTDGEYAASVNCWHSYKMVTRSLMHRWTYPLVPDMFISDKEEPYLYLRGNVYKQHPVTLSKGCVLKEESIVGSGSKVGENTTVQRSVIGQNCSIGKNVVIEDSYIWNKCIVEDNCVVKKSVVGMNCKLRGNVNLSQGCVLGSNVELPPGTKCSQRVQAAPDSESEWEVLGPKAYVMLLNEDNSDSEDGITKQPWLDLYPNEYHLQDEDSDSDVSSQSSQNTSRSASPVLDDTNFFYNEVVDSLTRGFDCKIHCDNLILEINSSRYAYNVSMSEVNLLVMKAILNMPSLKPEPYLQNLWHLLSYFMPILVNYIRNPAAQIDCLQALKEVFHIQPALPQGVSKLLNLLYSKDVLSEEVILEWFERLSCESETKSLCAAAAPFIKWLKEAEEESESDEDSD